MKHATGLCLRKEVYRGLPLTSRGAAVRTRVLPQKREAPQLRVSRLFNSLALWHFLTTVNKIVNNATTTSKRLQV
jgi:hypothetical protein